MTNNHNTDLHPDFAVVHTSAATHRIQMRAADTFSTRLVGLIGKAALAEGHGLLITKCSSVHTCFMRHTIDVVYLDAQGRIVKCVERMRPWRFSRGGMRAAHTLELAAGAIEALGLSTGDRVEHPLLHGSKPVLTREIAKPVVPVAQRGAAAIEFVIVGPILTAVGLAIIQYGLLFFAKNQINHASFMAARAGSMANANLNSIRDAYTTALIPSYGGGTGPVELAQAKAKAAADVGRFTRIEMLSPTKESFDDWNDQKLQDTIGGGRRVINNNALAERPNTVKNNSGQSVQDANLIKLRITHGFEMKVPMVNKIYTTYLKWLDTKTDPFHTQIVEAGRIPVMTHVTLRMQSHPIEPDNPVSLPGPGTPNPSDPGDPPVVDPGVNPPPDCITMGCTVGNPGGGGGGGGGGCTGDQPPVSPAPSL